MSSCAAKRSARVNPCACSTPPATATRRCSIIPSSSESTANRTRTSRSASASMCASAPTSRAWSCAMPSLSCARARNRVSSPARSNACARASSEASNARRCGGGLHRHEPQMNTDGGDRDLRLISTRTISVYLCSSVVWLAWACAPRFLSDNPSREDAMQIEQLLQSIQACLCAPDPLPAVEALLRTVVSNPAALREELSERHGGGQSQGFDVFCRSATLTVFHASLAPGFRNAPHDHGTWAVVGVYDGTERNQFFRRRGQTF